MKGKIISITSVIMEDFSEKFRVDILFDSPPDLRIGECELKQ